MAKDSASPSAGHNQSPLAGSEFALSRSPERSEGTAKGQSFEEAFAQLERTVQALDAGGLTLEQATDLFGEGMRLAKVCHDMLDATELKVRQLQVNFGQQIRLIDGGGNGPC